MTDIVTIVSTEQTGNGFSVNGSPYTTNVNTEIKTGIIQNIASKTGTDASILLCIRISRRFVFKKSVATRKPETAASLLSIF